MECASYNQKNFFLILRKTKGGLRYFAFLLLILFCSSVLSKKKPHIIFVQDDIPILNNKEANKLWTQNSLYLKSMKKNCSQKKSLLKKISFSKKQMQEIAKYSRKSYKKYRYSFYKVKKMRYGKNKGSLGHILSDMDSILSSKHINYEQTKNKNLKKSCRKLRKDFILSYSSYYNMPDNVSPREKMAPWAKEIVSSLDCLCS